MGARGAAQGRARLQKAAGRAPGQLAAGALSGLRTPGPHRPYHCDHLPGGRAAMLRVRCLRGGSRGAEAVHYIGSRVRAPPASLAPLLFPS